MRRFSKLGVVAALMYVASSGVGASPYTGIRVVPDIEVDFRFYRVSGPDVASVVRQIAVPASAARGHIGMASYQLSWHLQTTPAAARCELEQARVVARIEVTVPQWVDKGRASARDRQQWDRLMAAMFDYEGRHRDILLESVSQLGIQLAQLPVTDDCNALQRQGWQQGQAILASTRERFAALQQQSDRGRKLGLGWPSGN